MPVRIDAAACTRCGLCVEECPSSTLAAGPEEPQVAHPERCVYCGHCMAICPADAVGIAPSPGERFPAVEDVHPDLPPVERLLLTKRSVRAFREKPLTEHTIRRIIGYGARAPSSHNFRTRHYIAITDAETIRSMDTAVIRSLRPARVALNRLSLGIVSAVSRESGRDLRSLRAALDKVVSEHDNGGLPIFRGAPCVICVSAARRNGQGRDGCAAALQYMMLYAQSVGVCSCVMGYAQHSHAAIEKLLGVEHSHAIHAVGIFGYPRNPYERALRYTDVPVDIR